MRALIIIAIGLGFYGIAMTCAWMVAIGRVDDVNRDLDFWRRRYMANEDYIEKLRKRMPLATNGTRRSS